MGSQCSTNPERHKLVNHRNSAMAKSPSPYLGLAVLQANRAASLVAGPCSDELQVEVARRLILKAKNDGGTVSVIEGCLYIDYRFVGYLPPGVTA